MSPRKAPKRAKRRRSAARSNLRPAAGTVAATGPSNAKGKNWGKYVAATYLRMISAGKLSQKDAAKSAGLSERSLRTLEADPVRLKAARDEARELWMNAAEDAAMKAVINSMQRGNADLGLRFLERVNPRLEPKGKLEHSGEVAMPGLTVVISES